MNLQQEIAAIIKERKKAALAIVVQTAGSTPLKAGARMVVHKDGSISGTLGGGRFEYAVMKQAAGIIQSQVPLVFKHELTRDHEMCCGGSMWVYIEPVELPDLLVVLGAGHIGKALASLAASAGFRVTLVDERKEMFDGFIPAPGMVCENTDPVEWIDTICMDNRTYVTIATHDHHLDRKLLSRCIKRETGYLGMIGSMRKVIITKKMFIHQGLATTDELSRVDMPMGLPINACNMQEIAVSILASVIKTKNKNRVSLKKPLDLTDEAVCLTLSAAQLKGN